MLWRRFDEKVERTPAPHRRTPARALLAAGGTLLLLALLEGGVRWALGLAAEHRALRGRGGCCSSPSSLVERRAAEPVLPLWVFRQPAC